jgi:hypothetical protein
MAEQFLRAWAADAALLGRVIGGRDRTLVARACSTDRCDEVRRSVESKHVTLEERLEGLIVGPQPTRTAWHNRRCMTLFADLYGVRVDNEPTLPGRGWQELGPAFAHWELAGLALLWDREPDWALGVGLSGDWPRIFMCPSAGLDSLIRELGAFDARVIEKIGVPRHVPRFGAGVWPLDRLASITAMLVGEISQWAKAAAREQHSLFIWLDGQQ